MLLLIALRDYLENSDGIESYIKPQVITDIYLKKICIGMMKNSIS